MYFCTMYLSWGVKLSSSRQDLRRWPSFLLLLHILIIPTDSSLCRYLSYEDGTFTSWPTDIMFTREMSESRSFMRPNPTTGTSSSKGLTTTTRESTSARYVHDFHPPQMVLDTLCHTKKKHFLCRLLLPQEEGGECQVVTFPSSHSSCMKNTCLIFQFSWISESIFAKVYTRPTTNPIRKQAAGSLYSLLMSFLLLYVHLVDLLQTEGKGS